MPRLPDGTRADGGVVLRRLSVGEVEAMIAAGVVAPDERFELIDGDIFNTSPKHRRHEAVKLALVRRLVLAVPDAVTVGVATTLFLDTNTFVDPDVSVFPGTIPSDQVRPRDLALLVEVAVMTLAYGRNVKAALYARHGVALFWLVDAERRETWVHAEPKDGMWGLVRRVAAEEPLTLDAVPGFAFRLADLG